MKKLLCLVLTACMVFALAGCGNSEEIAALNSVQALNSESTVTNNYKLSWSDEEDLVYAQVASRQLLDLSILDACTDNELQQVLSFMNQVDNQLIGNLRTATYTSLTEKYITENLVEDEAVIDTYMTDYLLTFFQKTPYYWQRSKTTIRGVDPSSRSIIVDVQYSTIDFDKDVRSDSFIVRGEPDYEKLVQNRYFKWVNILSTRLYDPYSTQLEELEENFKLYYGDPEEIIESQRMLTPTNEIYETGNQFTTTGMIDSAYERSGATCSVRYILVPNYVMGINLGLSCTNMYLTSFKLNDDPTGDMTPFTREGYATVTDSVYALIYNYFTCIDESNYAGLYKLTTDFSKLDKYYMDLFDSTYQKHNGFSVSLFDITGTHITCGVTISSKERAKNSNMTFPNYTDRYLMELELIDDTLKVSNMVHISRVLEGEPIIVSGDADISGFTAAITLDNDDKLSIEDLICKFGTLQLLVDVTSDNFAEVVDISITTNQLATLQESMLSLSGQQKSVFLTNYMQGTSNYASVRCREQFKDATGIVEANVTYEFISKGGRWYIYNYTVNSSMRLDADNLATSGALCLVSPGKVEAYTSQVKSTMSTNLESVSDTSVSYDHDAYTPVLKEAREETIDKVSGSTITSDQFGDISRTANLRFTSETFEQELSYVDMFLESYEMPDGVEPFSTQLFRTKAMDLIAVAYNVSNNRYLEDELNSDDLFADIDALRALITDFVDAYDDAEATNGAFGGIITFVDSLETWLRGRVG